MLFQEHVRPQHQCGRRKASLLAFVTLISSWPLSLTRYLNVRNLVSDFDGWECCQGASEQKVGQQEITNWVDGPFKGKDMERPSQADASLHSGEMFRMILVNFKVNTHNKL